MKKIILAISLLTSSHLVSGEPHDLFHEQLDDPNNPGNILPQDSELNSPFYEFPTPAPPAISDQKIGYLKALKLLKNKQLPEAEKAINSLIKQYPDEAEFYNLRALLGTYKNDKKLAINSYQKAIALDANNLAAYLGLSLYSIVERDFVDAKKYANKALTINDKSISAYFLLADIAQKENREQDIEGYLLTAHNKIQGNIKQEIAVANKLSVFYISQNQPEKLLAHAEDIIKHHPGNSLALSFLAATQLLNNKVQLSIQTLEKLIRLQPRDVRHRLILASILTRQGNNDDKVYKLLDEAISIEPNNPQAYIQKTHALTRQKLFPEALEQLKKVKQLSPESGQAELLQGNIFLAEKKLDKALTSYQKSYQIKPNSKVANQIVKIMITQGKQQDAINFLSTALEKNPDSLNTHFKLATLYQQLNKTEKAEKHFQFILARQPDNALVLNNLAWIYYQQNNPKALALAEKAYQKAPNSYAVADTYGVILVKQGDLKKGIKILQQASQQAPSVYDIQYHLANAYALNGDDKKALEILNTIVKSENDFPEKQSASTLLEKLKQTK